MSGFLTRTTVATVMALLLGLATGAMGATQTVQFSLNGSGALLNSPVVFQGTIDSGPMSPGLFVIQIDDAGWPLDDPGTPGNERWNYLLTNFFTYDNTAGGQHWDGYFPKQGTLLPPVTWRFGKNGDRLGGVIRYLIITIRDSDADGMVDQDELANQMVAANFQCHVEQSGGAYDGWCGAGSANGNLEDFDPNMDDLLTISVGNLLLRDFGCAVHADAKTWGALKQMYR